MLAELIRKRVSTCKGSPPAILANPANPATDTPETGPRIARIAEIAGGTPHSAKRESPPTEHTVGREAADSATIIPSQPTEEPTPPLQAGWRIVYLDSLWKLVGGSDDPDHGTVDVCRWEDEAWTVLLTDGQQIPLSRIRSVGAVDHKGRCYGAWTVAAHGLDGNG